MHPVLLAIPMSMQLETQNEFQTAAQHVQPVQDVLELPVLLDRPLPIFHVETTQTRWIWLVIAGLVVWLYGQQTLRYWAPADGGVDQNAYLLGGRMIAEHFSTRYTLPNPYAYVGGMMIRTSKIDVPLGDYYPKYPLGLPLLYACFFWIVGPTKAAALAFLVSPIASIFAVAGMFFLARLLAGSFCGLMAAILLGTSELMIELSNNPNSHASCLAFIVWGMYFLLKWWQSIGGWRTIFLGILAGFLIGYAGLIRYSEGLLVLPIAVACASRLRWTDWKSYLRCAIPGFAWAVPIAVMLVFNKLSMGNWTGYDSTNESEGFTWLKFTQTWEQMLRTYYDTAAFFVFPLGLAGIAMVFGRSWKLGLMLLAWLLPGSALYTSYYWSPDRGVSYARFFLVFLPAIMLGVAICFSDGILAPMRNARWYLKIPRIAAVLVVVGIAGNLGIYRSVHGMQQGLGGGGGFGGGSQSLAEQQHVRQNLAIMGNVLLKNVPVNAVLFADSGVGQGGGGNERPLNYIQFLRHWDTYSTDAFDATRRGSMGGGNFNPLGNNFGLGNVGFGNVLPADPNPVPTPRQKLQTDYEALITSKSLSDRRAQQADVINSALKNHRGVYALGLVSNDRDMRIKFNLVGKYSITVVDSWSDLPPLPIDTVADNAGNTTGRGGRGGLFGGGAGGPGGGGRRGNNGGGGGGRRGATPATDSTAKWELLEIKPAS
jgi:hypothetical protein